MLQLDNIMNQTFLSMISDTWQMLTIIAAALGVGYAMARRFEGLLGKDNKGNTLLERIEKIERQVTPNGGSSMSDKIDYIRRDQNKMKNELSQISGELEVIKDIVISIVDK
jgi:hypothetical protein